VRSWYFPLIALCQVGVVPEGSSEAIGIAGEKQTKNRNAIPIDSRGDVSFILEHIMNNWASPWFSKTGKKLGWLHRIEGSGA
jgi:hypothetical protein